jgi:peptide methionine sulfoxide reductase MsrB
VRLSFSGPPSVPDKVIAVPANWPGQWLDGAGNKLQGSGLTVAPGATAAWYFLRQNIDWDGQVYENDAVSLPTSPPPDSFKLSLSFDGFSSPWTVSKPLVAHKNPTSSGSYLYPAHFDDLRAGEFWFTGSNTHATGALGSQLFAYDMIVMAWDPAIGGANKILPGMSGAKNEAYRAWGKKIYAMADGTVAHYLDGVGANYHPGVSNDGPWKEPPWDDVSRAWTDHVGAGNHFYIRHGEEVVLYAHMQKGTLNPNLLHANAIVKAGDLLGLCGNAGSASEPHLHIHAIKGTVAEEGPLRPLLLHDVFAIDRQKLTLPSISGAWTRLERQGPPAATQGAFIWPLGRNPQWQGWEDLGGTVASAPAVASGAPNRLDVFAARTNGSLGHKRWDGATWHAWEDLVGTFKGAPAAVSWGSNRIDIVVRGMDDHLGHLWFDGSSWHGWEDIGGPVTSGPAVSSWGPNRIDVFAARSNGGLGHKRWDGTTWHGWEDLGGTFKGAPAAVSWGSNRIDIVVRGMDDHLGHLWFDGSSWHGWEDIGGPVTSGAAVSSWGPNHLDVFAAGADGQLATTRWDGSHWAPLDWVGGQMLDTPAVASRDSNRIDVFVRGADSHLGHLWWS